MSNLGRLSEEHEKAQKQYKIIPIIKPEVHKPQENDSKFLKELRKLEAYKAKKRAEKAKKIAKESKTGDPKELGKYVYSTPKKESTLKDPNSAVSAASGKTDSPYRSYPSSPVFPNINDRQGTNVLMSVSDPNLPMRGSPSYDQLVAMNDAASDATSGDSGPSSTTNTPATSPPRKKNPANKNPTNDDSQGDTQSQGNTQTEMDTQPDDPLEFGGKKKRKKGKKTKRANNAKKARKTKKKRSNKK